MRLITFIFLFFICNQIFPQDCELKSYKDKREAKKIRKFINDKNFLQANVILKNSKEHPVFNSLKAELFWLENNNSAAKKIANEVLYICDETFPVVYYILGEIAYIEKDFVLSANYLQKSLQFGLDGVYYENTVKFLPQALELSDLINNPVKYVPEIISGISTDYDEYLPAISPDQDFTFFTRRFLKKGIDIITPSYQEEFFMSKKIDGEYSIGSALSYPFNIEDNEGGACITIDNNTLYFTKCSKVAGNYNNCDIFYSNKVDGEWGDIKSFNKEISPLYSWESQPSVSSDGNYIVFASDRGGGYGGIDLYGIEKNNDGKWSKPKNLGDIINSANNEKSPFLHTDNNTLFFASDNFPSLGGYDIFYSRKDSFGNWQKPVNIGYPINSSLNEISLFVSTDGYKAFFASNNLNGIGGWDIYSFDLHDEAKPKRVFFIKGDLLDVYGEIIDDVEIEIKNIKTNEVTVFKVKNGKYAAAVTLSDNDDVLVTIKKKGYAFNSQYVSADDTSFLSPKTMDIKLRDIEVGESFLLNNIYFDLNSYDINNVSDEIILEFASYLEINNNLIISINGYTDNIGEVEYNKKLSKKRALAVFQKLVANGVSEKRLAYKGFGEQFPKNNNVTEIDRELNRRTEFYIIKK